MHKVIVAQENAAMNAHANAAYSQGGYPQPQLTNSAAYSPAGQSNAVSTLYPGLGDFMGLELSQDVIALNMPEYMQTNQAVSVTRMISCVNFQFVVAYRNSRLIEIDKLIDFNRCCCSFFYR